VLPETGYQTRISSADKILKATPILYEQSRSPKVNEVLTLELANRPRHGFPCRADEFSNFFALDVNRQLLSSGHPMISEGAMKKQEFWGWFGKLDTDLS
jgi:hypothetical protein